LGERFHNGRLADTASSLDEESGLPITAFLPLKKAVINLAFEESFRFHIFYSSNANIADILASSKFYLKFFSISSKSETAFFSKSSKS